MYYNLRLDMMKPKVNENFWILNCRGILMCFVCIVRLKGYRGHAYERAIYCVKD